MARPFMAEKGLSINLQTIYFSVCSILTQDLKLSVLGSILFRQIFPVTHGSHCIYLIRSFYGG